MTSTNNTITDYRSKEAYDHIVSLAAKPEDLMALQRAKRERAIALDRSLTLTAELWRKLKAVSDRLLEALVRYEDYIAKALKAYEQFTPSPQTIEIEFWIYGDKDRRHLTYPDWYYQHDYKPSRQQRMELVQLEKEMAAEPNWLDVNDALYCEEYRTGDNEDQTNNNFYDWLKMSWSADATERITQIISKRTQRMEQLSAKDADGICEAFYLIKDIYSLALEDMLDITTYKVDLHAEIANY